MHNGRSCTHTVGAPERTSSSLKLSTPASSVNAGMRSPSFDGAFVWNGISTPPSSSCESTLNSGNLAIKAHKFLCRDAAVEKPVTMSHNCTKFVSCENTNRRLSHTPTHTCPLRSIHHISSKLPQALKLRLHRRIFPGQGGSQLCAARFHSSTGG